MKKRFLVMALLGFLFLLPSLAQSQPEKFFDRLLGPVLHPSDLRILQLEMFPVPVSPGQEVRFRVRLRNDGNPLRGNIRIQDRHQVVAQLNDLFLPRGYSEYHFPYTRYQFQRFDHCFTVVVDVERTPHRVDAARELCAKPTGLDTETVM